jgi:hypothetical protein
MRTIRNAFQMLLLTTLGIACGGSTLPPPPPPSDAPSASPSGSPAPPPTITITLGLNPKHPDQTDDEELQGGKCDVIDVQPSSVKADDSVQTVNWSFVNNCKNEVPAMIRPGKKLFPKSSYNDPFGGTGQPIRPSPFPIPVSTGTAPTAMASANLDPNAEDGNYKYDIVGGGINVDPEIEVRRGGKLATQTDTTGEQGRSPRPTASPSGR